MPQSRKAYDRNYSKIYALTHKALRQAYDKVYSATHKDAIKTKNHNYYLTHKTSILQKQKVSNKLKYNTNTQFCLIKRLRSRLVHALNGNFKSGSAIADLGCSIEFFKTYIEGLFTLGMSWDNKDKWQIDHIIPLSSFDLTDRAQLLKACNYKNLQPLWTSDNLKKSNNIPTKI